MSKTPQAQSYHDFPLQELAKRADEIVAAGGTVYLKWTCGGCGARCISDQPNVFHVQMQHEACGFITDIRKTGANYLTVMAFERSGDERLN